MASPVEIGIIAFINAFLGHFVRKWWENRPVDPYISRGMVPPKSAAKLVKKSGDSDIADKWGGSLNTTPDALEDLRPVQGHVLQDAGNAGDVTKQ